MSQNKNIHQIVTDDGQAACKAVSAPGWFAQDCSDIPVASDTLWGPMYAPPRAGNRVEFFTTGKAYFENAKAAIESASQCVFITGWQVNFDVELTPGHTLLTSLVKALKNGADVYVLPWQNVPGAVDTAALTTALAVSLLNSVPGIKGRAWCLTAPVQSDQGVGNIMFSHHQKSVVVDNKIAYCGGIDLAYGRRDDEQFGLKAQGRKLNELYNPCVAAIYSPSNTDLRHCVTPMELLAAIGTHGLTRTVATFFTSPADTMAPAWDVLAKAKDLTAEQADKLAEKWNNINLLGDLINVLQDKVVDTAQARVRASDAVLKQKLQALAEVHGANAANVASALVAWLSGKPINRLPPKVHSEINHMIKSVFWAIAVLTNSNGWKPPAHYERLFGQGRAVPILGDTPDGDVQPRMPWQDVQCRIEGPSVWDLSNNFVGRWNATAEQLEGDTAKYRGAINGVLGAIPGSKTAVASLASLFNTLGVRLPSSTTLPRVAAAHTLSAPAAPMGQCSVQIVRSAGTTLLNLEARSRKDKTRAARAQNNCLKATLKAISSAKHFIYVEGQFFQTAHGASGEVQEGFSGPMERLLTLSTSPQYREFMRLLEIDGVAAKDIPSHIRWAKIDDVLRKAQGEQFMLDLTTVLHNLATREILTQPTAPQAQLQNPIGKALVERITQVGLKDGLPFHVYLVLPVHPEGTLNTLNIMSQVHLTMHSLVFGEHSLVNGVRRAILTERLQRQKKISWAQAQAQVNAMDLVDIVNEARHDWKRFITLLNLRNWDTIGGKPVTEQIYVHSKLLIADDQVAVLGSANINDRSMLGDRDSELAAVITSNNKVQAPIAGPMQSVAKEVHELRVNLWKKHFGAGASGRQASALLSDAVLKSPGLPATWQAIQAAADENARLYNSAFWYIPRSEARPEIQPKDPQDKEPGGPPASIWPTWKYQSYLNHSQGGRLLYRMPFEPLFWRKAEHNEQSQSWEPAPDAKRSMAPVMAPRAIQGFIVALPTEWTRREDNLFSKSHIRTIAVNEQPSPSQALALQRSQTPETSTT